MGALVRAHDWAATPLGPIAAWPQSLRTAAQVVVSNRFPMIALWGRDLIQIYNDAYRGLMGTKHPAGLGQPNRACWPEVWHINEPIYRRVLAGEALEVEDGLFRITRHGAPEDAWFTVGYAPLHDEAGRVAGVLVTVHETTARVLADRRRAAAETALRDSEQRHRLLVESVAQAVWETDADGVLADPSPSWCAYTGQAVAEARGDGWLAAIHPEDRALADAAWRAAVAAKRPMQGEWRLRHAVSGGWRWTQVRAAPVPGPGGTVRRWVGMNIDIEDRKAAEAALRDQEQRLAFALEAADLGTWELDLTTDTSSVRSLRHDQMFGYAEPQAEWGQAIAERHVLEEDRPIFRAAFARARETGVLEFEVRVRWPDGTIHWIAPRGRTFFDAQGRPVRMSGVVADITARKRDEERQALLAREVDHRAKNALAVVQTILRLTRAPTPESFVRAVEARVAALARVQTLLAARHWDGADLRALLDGELAPFAPAGRVRLDGRAVTLPPGMAQPLAMAVHELATNAAKHGALSVPDGRVRLAWRLGEGRLALRWAEYGGPPVAGPPARRGFGSRVLERTLGAQLGGQVTLRWRPSGLVCEMALPLATGRHAATDAA